MFPLPWNKAYRKKDGSLATIDDAIQNGGGQYELPTASASTKGGVKIGSGLTMDGESLNADEQLPEYSSSESGKVLGVDADGDLEWATPGGGSEIYYKDYDYSNVTFSQPTAIGESGLNLFTVASAIPTQLDWNIQGYKIINVEVIDNYGNYIYFLSWTNYLYNGEKVSFKAMISNRASIAGHFKIRVFYVPDNTVVPVPTT